MSWLWSPPPVQYYEPQSIVLQAPCLPDTTPWIYSSPYNHKVFYLSHTWMVFLTFFNLSLLCNKELMMWATISSRFYFSWLHRTSPILTAENVISMISVLTIWWCPCIRSSLVKNKCRKAKWLPEEALKIAEKEIWKTKQNRKDIPSWM